MSAHQNGSMDPEPHERVFQNFLRVAAGVFAAVLLILLFLAVVGT